MMSTAPPREVLVFDLTGFSDLPPHIVEALVRARSACCDVEVLNPSPRVQELLRGAELDSILIRGSNSLFHNPS